MTAPFAGRGFACALRRVPWITLAVACAAIVIPGRFEYDRAAILRGDVWRLVTGHLTHWSPDHLLWDVVAFVTLGVACERRHGFFGATLLASAVAVSLFLLIARPEIVSYRGLSAIDSALWIWAALRIRDHSRTFALMLSSVFAAKLVFEAASGSPLFVAQTNDVLVLPVVHLLGGAIGFMAGVIDRRGDDAVSMTPEARKAYDDGRMIAARAGNDEAVQRARAALARLQ